MLHKAVSLSSDTTWWWIKGDGCDVVKGIWESTRGVWSGDVDLNDGKLKSFQQKYQQQIEWCNGIGLMARSSPDKIKGDLNTALLSTDSELDFITSGTD